MSRPFLAPLAAATAVLAFAAFAPRPAGADEAGTRSNFTDGVGGRALALGGAYVAAGDDAGALLWNPGGLGLVTRREILAGRGGYELGFSESFALVVLPSWRWGTVGLAVRTFGVDGIEQRDDRNTLLSSDLASAESEVTLGWGRALGEAWTLGGAVKLQRHSLAGFSGGGLGADLGVTARPLMALGSRSPLAERLTWGLAVRNVVEPRVRLDREGVGDPATLRTGVAWRAPGLLASLDLERSRDAGTGLHAGVETWLRSVLALRAGLDGRTLTAGAGVRVQGVHVDYAFENRSLGLNHRMSVSFPFGRTVLESRQAALRAEEDRLRERLAEAFQQREEERVAALLARARAARGAGRFDEAFEVLATVLTLQPEHAEARSLETECVRGSALQLEEGGDFAAATAAWARAVAAQPGDSVAVAGELRCRTESDRRAERTAEIRRAFAQAMDAFGSDDLATAREGFAGVVAAAPADSDAVTMLRRTDLAIARRVAGLLREARRQVELGRLAEAGRALDQAAALDRRADGLLQAQAALAEARRAPAAAPAAAPAPAPAGRAALDPQRAREVQDLYRRALDAMAQKRSEDAVRYLELVWSADPGYQRAADYLKREYLMRGLESFAGGRLDEAVAQWEKALQVDPNDERARGYLARALKQRARTQEILGAAR